MSELSHFFSTSLTSCVNLFLSIYFLVLAFSVKLVNQNSNFTQRPFLNLISYTKIYSSNQNWTPSATQSFMEMCQKGFYF
jgi:hypothetical protein